MKVIGETCKTCGEHKSKCNCAKAGRGAKFSEGKPDYTLLPLKALEGTIRVLEHGLVKYARDNWKKVPEGEHEYLKAMFRHLADILDGEEIDPDSGLPHWNHVMCNALFISWFRKQRGV